MTAASNASFGTDGKVTTDFASWSDQANSMTIQADGQLVVVGYSSGNFALARYNIYGTLDPDFGTNGKVTTDFAGGP